MSKKKKQVEEPLPVNPNSTRIIDAVNHYMKLVYEDRVIPSQQVKEVTDAYKAGAFRMFIAMTALKSKAESQVFFTELNIEHMRWVQDISKSAKNLQGAPNVDPS